MAKSFSLHWEYFGRVLVRATYEEEVASQPSFMPSLSLNTCDDESTFPRFLWYGFVADIVAAFADHASGGAVRRGTPVGAEQDALWALRESSHASNWITG